MNWQTIAPEALASLVAGICVVIIFRVMDWRWTTWFARRSRAKQDREIPKRLQKYLGCLCEQTLQINHPWMKEGQTLGNVLVPVGMMVHGQRIDLRSFLLSELQRDETPRFLILGAPGSGKSIAMGDIARFFATLQKPRSPTPVMLTFSDLKGAATNADLEKVIALKLQRYQFTEAQPNSQAPTLFVVNRLYKGEIILLIDGYDELERDLRASTAAFIREFLETYRQIPVVLASRKAVYERENPFASLVSQVLTMAPFSPLAIARFVSQWRFDEGKSSQELLSHINGKAHLNELASNPLMLTIICFLYSQPKYLLPDNRVEFYRECCRALLEKWDLAKLTARANKFETDHKMDVLSRIAFFHISNGETTDEEISATEIGEITRKALQALSINPGAKDKIIREIVENSGLLVELPPDGFRFPHRTFLEFFAAVYLYEQKEVDDALKLYKEDETRWRTTILMYAGLCKKPDRTERLLASLSSDFIRTRNQSDDVDVSVFSALLETSFASPDAAENILALAKDHIETSKPLCLRLVEELGYIAANTMRTYSEKAREILRNLLATDLHDRPLQIVISAAMRCRSDDVIRSRIAARLEELNLVEFFIGAGDQAAYYLHRLLEVGIDTERKLRLLKGLREGNHLQLLANIMMGSSDSELADRAAETLFYCSETPSFMDFLDDCGVEQLDPEVAKEIEKTLSIKKWPLPYPTTESGRLLALAIAYYAARTDVPQYRSHKRTYVIPSHGAQWVAFLIQIFIARSGKRAFPVESDINEYVPRPVLTKFWQDIPASGSAWHQAWRIEISGGYDISSIFVFALCALSGFAEVFISLEMMHAFLSVDAIIFISIPLFSAIAGYLRWAGSKMLLLALATPIAFCCILLSSLSLRQFRARVIELFEQIRSGEVRPAWYGGEIYQIFGVALLVSSVVVVVALGTSWWVPVICCNGLVLLCWTEQTFILRFVLFGGEKNFSVGYEILRSNADEILPSLHWWEKLNVRAPRRGRVVRTYPH